jgi:hypothetical protein
LSPSVSAALEEMRKAIALEIRASSTDSSRNVDVSKGRLLAETQEGFLYSFSADIQVPVPPETTVIFKAPDGSRFQGIWIGQDEFEILLTLHEKLEPSVKRGRLIINLSFILEALSEKLPEVEKGPGRCLVQHLLSGTSPDGIKGPLHIEQSLCELRAAGQLINSSQEAAIRSSLRESIHYVWGPPGTGKTANLSHVCRALCNENERILIVAHSNAAVDVAMLRVAEAMEGQPLLTQGKVLRVGFSQSPEVRRHRYLTVLGILRQTEPDLLDKWERLEELRRALQAQLREATATVAKSIEPRLNEVRRQLEALRARLREVESTLIDQSFVLGCTAAKSIIDQRIWQRKIENVVVDEVSMMNFPFVTALASRASKRLLQFGDFRQLPPIVISEEEEARKWLEDDSFNIAGVTKSVEQGVPDKRITMLEEQFRMHSSICNVVSLLSYGERLITAEGVDKRVDHIIQAAPFPGQSLLLADTSEYHSVCLKELKPGRFSRVNLLHAVISLNMAHNFLVSGTDADVCIITPYRAQARLVSALASELDIDVTVATVHKFQGSERSVVIFDVCDAFPQQKASRLTGHAPDIARRLMNVGISRAKGKLVVLADRQFISNYHDGRSPARKICAYLAQFGVANPLELDDLDSNQPTFEWFDDFRSTQLVLSQELARSKHAHLNLPDDFHLSAQVTRLIESLGDRVVTARAPKVIAQQLTGKTADLETSVGSGGFYVLLDHAAFIGGHEAGSPVVLVRGNVAGPFAHVLLGDEQEVRSGSSSPG